MRIGIGWDSHRLTAQRPLLLGGVQVPAPFGEDGHSDGDVLLHTIIDALLGAAALGDIGTHFPPSDQRWKDACSSELLTTVCRLINAEGLSVHSIDSTIILQRPRLAPHIEQIRSSLAQLLHIDLSYVSVKAKTAEGLGPVGEGLSIEAQAVVLLHEETPDIWL